MKTIRKSQYNFLKLLQKHHQDRQEVIEISDEEYEELQQYVHKPITIIDNSTPNPKPTNPEQEEYSVITYTALSKLIENNDNDFKEGYLNICDFDTPIKSHTFENNIGIIEFYGKLTKIGYNAFWECDNLISINIPNTIITIRNGAFHGCNLLSSVVLSNNLKNIDTNVFGLCNSLSNIIIPNSVIQIGSGAFSGCKSLTEINIPTSLTNIESSVFNCCESLTEINIPNSVTQIGFGAFSGCKSLTNINIPNSVTSINNMVFHNCSSLTNVILPNTIYSINTAAFASCINLQNINIPESIIYIDNDAFKSCIKLSNECKEKILAINPNCNFSIQ